MALFGRFAAVFAEPTLLRTIACCRATGWFDTYKVRPVRSFSADSDKAISAFTFPTSTGTTIDESVHTIAVTVPCGTDVTDLAASFTTSGAVVAVGSTPQTSGTTANDFTSPVIYRVTAADASSQAYTVTVTVAPLATGDAYQGGIVAYILHPGDPGYVAGETHGLIAATADQSTGIGWIWGPANHHLERQYIDSSRHGASQYERHDDSN